MVDPSGIRAADDDRERVARELREHMLAGRLRPEEFEERVGKAYDALPRDGSLIVFEALIDDDRRANAFGLLMSLNMLIETPGGFDYTGADCQGWLREAGFRSSRVEHLVGPDAMVVGVK